MQIYTLTAAEAELINAMQGLIVCDHGLGYMGVDPVALQNSQAHLDALGGYDAERVVTFDRVSHRLANRLAILKRRRIRQVNQRTSQLVTAGLEVATGKLVSTSLEAQQNLHGLAILVLMGQDPFPQGVSCTDGDQYAIVDLADFNRIVGLMQTHKLTRLDAGRQLRQDIIAAADEAALDLVTDARS